MKVDVPGRGAVDISRVAVVGPAWTDLDTYRETCEYLHEAANAGGPGTASTSSSPTASPTGTCRGT